MIRDFIINEQLMTDEQRAGRDILASLENAENDLPLHIFLKSSLPTKLLTLLAEYVHEQDLPDLVGAGAQRIIVVPEDGENTIRALKPSIEKIYKSANVDILHREVLSKIAITFLTYEESEYGQKSLPLIQEKAHQLFALIDQHSARQPVIEYLAAQDRRDDSHKDFWMAIDWFKPHKPIAGNPAPDKGFKGPSHS